MTFHIRVVADLITSVRDSPAGGSVKIMVGGHPFNVAAELWRQIGADGSGHDAGEAATVANRLVEDASP
jgi:MerR family transcriptional regulator, light-induced transcriptional regulator